MRTAAVGSALLAVLAVSGCVADTDTAASATATAEATRTHAATRLAEPDGDVPTVVPRADVDERYVAHRDGDEFVLLAPGVYADMLADGIVGVRSNYSSYFGDCAAIERYSRRHPGRSTCG